MTPLTKAEQNRGHLLLLVELRTRDSPLVILDRLRGSRGPSSAGEGTAFTDGKLHAPIVPDSSKNQPRQLTVPSPLRVLSHRAKK